MIADKLESYTEWAVMVVTSQIRYERELYPGCLSKWLTAMLYELRNYRQSLDSATYGAIREVVKDKLLEDCHATWN